MITLHRLAANSDLRVILSSALAQLHCVMHFLTFGWICIDVFWSLLFLLLDTLGQIWLQMQLHHCRTMPNEWLVWVLEYSVKLLGQRIASRWKLWDFSLRNQWKRDEKSSTITLTTLNWPHWWNGYVTLDYTGDSLTTSACFSDCVVIIIY